MSPGINDHPRSTGAFPKSNRRSDRNRERDRVPVNQNSNCRRAPRAQAQHANNLFQLDWHPACELFQTSSRSTPTTSARTAKNSNARPSAPIASYDLPDIGAYNVHSRLYPNVHAREDLTPWLKMTSPVDQRTQSPPNLTAAKPTNTDKMPERGQVEGRLNQIREYIKVTSTMMDSLSQSSDPRAQAQHDKLSKMVEDLYDSEVKLSKLMEDCQKYWRPSENGELENGEDMREQELRKKVEESQHKLAQLQEHQAQLVGMQLRVRERLNEARQAQQALLVDDEEEEEEGEEHIQGAEEHPNQGNVDQLERETEVLRGKLQQLENKKRHMDHLMQELQAVEHIERASCSSEGSRTTGQRDKVAELEAMKAQLSHLKALMNNATGGREAVDGIPNSEPELVEDEPPIMNGNVGDVYQMEENNSNDYNDLDETVRPKRSELPSVEQIQAVTRELKEQQLMLQAARDELKRLKQGNGNPQTPPSLTSSTPPPSQATLVEKKQSNHTASNNGTVRQQAQNNRWQLEDLMRKDQITGLSVNQNGGPEWGSRRNSTSQHSHTSTTPGNLWPPPVNHDTAPHHHSVDGISTAENLLELGSQPPMENGFPGNFWSMPAMLANQPPQAAGAVVGSAEYYRQLLLGSQAQQLQLMSTTVQQCCQLLWSQQREMQSMRAAITQLQAQLRQSQSSSSNNNTEEQHSNLGRPAQPHFDVTPLPPSSSLPNLVSLPTTSPAPPPVNCHHQQPQQQQHHQQQQQQQQQPQLNNQVPPGNRANNYWDNFRSYSRQNLLSGSSKTVTDHTTVASSTSSSNTATGSHTSNNKCNRQQGLDAHLPSGDAQYSLNLQQIPQEERNNYVPMNEASASQQQQQPENSRVEEGATSFRRQPRLRDDDSCARIAKKIAGRDDLRHILMQCLNVLESRRRDESPLPSSNASNTTDSSDDESEAGARSNTTLPSAIGNLNSDNQVSTSELIDTASSAPILNYTTHQQVSEQSETSDTYSLVDTIEKYYHPMPSLSMTVSSSTQVHNDAIDPDIITQEASNNNQQTNSDNPYVDPVDSTNPDEAAAAISILTFDELKAEEERDRAEYVMLERTPSSQQPPRNRDSPRMDHLQK